MLEIVLMVIALVMIMRGKLGLPMAIAMVFFESYSFIGVSASQFIVKHNYSDLGLLIVLMVIIVLYARRSTVYDNSLRKLKMGVLVFLVFFILAAIVDITVNAVKLGSVLRIARTWACFALLWFTKDFRPSEVHATMKWLLIITVGICALFIFEYTSKVPITGAHHFTRAARANPSWMISLLVFTLLLNNYYKVNVWVKWISVIIISYQLFQAASRSLFIAYALSALMVFFVVDKKLTARKVAYLLLSIFVLFTTFATDNGFSRRFSQAQDDIGVIGRTNAQVSGSFSFRILLLSERMQYINKKTQFIVFGIGNIQEADMRQKIFRIGLRKGWRRTGNVSQLDTGDIVWAQLFLRNGYVGTFIYVVLIYIPFMRYFWRRTREGPLFSATALYFGMHLFLISFTYSAIGSSLFFAAPIVALRLTLPEKRLSLNEAHGRAENEPSLQESSAPTTA